MKLSGGNLILPRALWIVPADLSEPRTCVTRTGPGSVVNVKPLFGPTSSLYAAEMPSSTLRKDKSRPKMSSPRLLRGGRILLLLGILAVAGALLWWRFARAPEVAAVPATRGTAAEIVYGTGAVEPVRWAKVASLIRQRIVDLCYCEGKSVAKGDVLARLDDKEARAQLTELRAREDFAKRELSRATELMGRGAATTQAFERISSDLRQVQGLISVQMEKLDAYTITAPIEGVVLRRDGEIVEQGQILFRVGQPKPLHVIAEVNEEDIPRVAVDQIVLLRTDAFPGRRLEGKLYEITPMGDAIAKTYRIRVSLPDDTPLHIGMSMEANVVTREKANALLVPPTPCKAHVCSSSTTIAYGPGR